MGKEKFVVKMTLFLGVFMLFTIILYFILASVLSNIFLGSFDYFTKERVLELIFYIGIMIFIGIKMSSRLWDKNKIKFDGLNSVIKELEDEELKSLILKKDKLIAAKRYREITGAKTKEALRYVDLMRYYYSNNESNK